MQDQFDRQKSLLGPPCASGRDIMDGRDCLRALYVTYATVFFFLGSLVIFACSSQVQISESIRIPFLRLSRGSQNIGHSIALDGLSAHAGRFVHQASNFNFARADCARGDCGLREPFSLFHSKGFLNWGKTRARTLLRSATAPATDLTPAVDKYVRRPLETDAAEGDHQSSSGVVLTAKGAAPDGPDAFKLAEEELQPLSDYVNDLVLSENPVLTMAASHFFKKRQGKRFRPTIVVLMGRALQPSNQTEDVQRRQLMLSQITEMIHVASLIHDDVLDDADTRRGGQAVHTMYTNKVAVLGGDYLLARAALLLARLQHLQVVEVMSSALDSLVQGEIMQAQSSKDELLDMDYYLRKSYFKTASLISNACKSTAMLAGYAEKDDIAIAAEQFGYHLGMAYQIVDDILDFTGASAQLGKPAQADMQLGLATAPILYAAETNSDMRPIIRRRFKEPGDIQKVIKMAADTDCVAKSYELAEFHARKGKDALFRLEESDNRDALLKLLHNVLSRQS